MMRRYAGKWESVATRPMAESGPREVHMEAYFRVLDETARRKLGFVPWEQPARQRAAVPGCA